jgi:hypothetical protein
MHLVATVNGEAFNDRTIQMRRGSLYFVFGQDLGMQAQAGISKLQNKAGQ